MVTVLSIDPQEFYDVIAVNGASAATQLSGLPVSSRVGAVRIAPLADEDHPEGQWVAFPNHEQHSAALFEMVVAGRIVSRRQGRRTVEDVAIMMVEAGAGDGVVERIAQGAPAPQEATVAAGLEAAKPFIETLCQAQAGLAERAAKETQEFPLFPAYSEEIFAAVDKAARTKLSRLLTIATKQEREAATNEHMVDIEDKLLSRFVDSADDAAKEIRAAYNAVMKEIVQKRSSPRASGLTDAA